MVRTDITYSRNTLYLTLEGIVSRRVISKLQKRMFCIISEYDIKNVVIDIHHVMNVDNEAFYEFLEDYDNEFDGRLEVVE